eukprot:3395644-Rhodomonas_salina.2
MRCSQLEDVDCCNKRVPVQWENQPTTKSTPPAAARSRCESPFQSTFTGHWIAWPTPHSFNSIPTALPCTR